MTGADFSAWNHPCSCTDIPQEASHGSQDLGAGGAWWVLGVEVKEKVLLTCPGTDCRVGEGRFPVRHPCSVRGVDRKETSMSSGGTRTTHGCSVQASHCSLLLLPSTSFRALGLSSCGHGLSCWDMWDIPGPQMEPVSPALTGSLLTAGHWTTREAHMSLFRDPSARSGSSEAVLFSTAESEHTELNHTHS